MKPFLFIVWILLFIPLPLEARPYELKGELSGWLTWRDKVKEDYLLGLRYMPELTLSHPLSRESKLDLMASGNINFEAPTDGLVINRDTSSYDFYRLWGRWKTSRFEARGGLQKINFGPARILRSLMWFDRIDPRDPFDLTDGVKGLLLRYYFPDNTNIWLWGLYGNDEVKGLERAATEESSPEIGGRYQFPLTMGEMALSLHHRRTEKTFWPEANIAALKKAQEDRLALDAFFDAGPGLWFEAVIGRIKIDDENSLWSEQLTLGADYTFLTGIHLLGEHRIMAAGPDWDETASISSVSAFSADYGINMLDRINTIITYSWIDYERQAFMGWQRTYDDLRINILAFSGPKAAAGNFGGRGVQFIVTYNH